MSTELPMNRVQRLARMESLTNTNRKLIVALKSMGDMSDLKEVCISLDGLNVNVHDCYVGKVKLTVLFEEELTNNINELTKWDEGL